MKKFLIIILLLEPVILIGQNNKKVFNLQQEFWVSTGILPLNIGGALYGKAHYNLTETFGFNAGLSYGLAYPGNKNYKLSEIRTHGGTLSCGIVKKTRNIKRGKERKLTVLTSLSVIIGHNWEQARYYFKGIDYKDFTSERIYKQRYSFISPQLLIGATYKIRNRTHLEFGSYVIISEPKEYQGTQYFELYGNNAYALTGDFGFYFGMGYQLWLKSKK